MLSTSKVPMSYVLFDRGLPDTLICEDGVLWFTLNMSPEYDSRDVVHPKSVADIMFDLPVNWSYTLIYGGDVMCFTPNTPHTYVSRDISQIGTQTGA